MKKKITLAISFILALCMLCGCGEDPKKVTYKNKTYNDLATETVSQAASLVGISQALTQYEDLAKIDLADMTDTDMSLLEQYQIPKMTIEALGNWAKMEQTYGKCVDFDPNALPQSNEDMILFTQQFLATHDFDVTKAGDTVTADLLLTFDQRKVTFELVYDYYDMSVTSISITEIKSLGEKMSNAGKNTLISMSIVFTVLILISLIISCFKIFPYLEEKKKQKAAANTNTAAPVAAEAAAPAQDTIQTDDSELIAVIAAAIAASEGTSTSDFVVRSINRR